MSLSLVDFPDRIRSKIITNGPTPSSPLRPVNGSCWLFDSWHNSAGYPYISVDGRDQPAHRVVFILATGQDIDGLDLDHVCRNVACVRPDHHEAVTHAENIRRMGQAQTKCRKAGHDWTDPRNVYTRPNGRRYCVQCYGGGRGHAKKYSDETIRSVRARVAAGETQAAVGRDLGIGSGLMSRIVNGKYRAEA